MLKIIKLGLILGVLTLVSCEVNKSSNLEKLIPKESTQIAVFKTESIEDLISSEKGAKEALADLLNIQVDLLPNSIGKIGIDKKQDLFYFQYSSNDLSYPNHVILLGLKNEFYIKKLLSLGYNDLDWKKNDLYDYVLVNDQLIALSKHTAYVIIKNKKNRGSADLLNDLNHIIEQKKGSITEEPGFNEFLTRVKQIGYFSNMDALCSNFEDYHSSYSKFSLAFFPDVVEQSVFVSSYLEFTDHTIALSSDLNVSKDKKIENEYKGILKNPQVMNGLNYLPTDLPFVFSLGLNPDKVYDKLLNMIAKNNSQGIALSLSSLELFLNVKGSNTKALISMLSGDVVIASSHIASNLSLMQDTNFVIMLGLNKGISPSPLLDLLSMFRTRNMKVWVQDQVLYLVNNPQYYNAIKNKIIGSENFFQNTFCQTIKGHAIACRVNKTVVNELPMLKDLPAISNSVESLEWSYSANNSSLLNINVAKGQSPFTEFIHLLKYIK